MPPGSSNAISLPRKRKVSTACTNCQNLRIKCAGQQDQPCANCIDTNVECVRNPSQDGRSKIPIRQRLKSLEEDQDLFFRLLRTLRHDNQQVDSLLEYIVNEKASLKEIRQYMDHHFLPEDLERSFDLLEMDDEEGGSGYPATISTHRALSISRLCDIPPYTGPACPWTTVTDDSGLVSHLISLYFTWNHLFFNWIDRDLFLRDLNSGNADSPFCSPFLVNAILADACWYSSYPETCALSGDITTKGQHFWEEARRLLDAQGGKLTLPTVQGMAIMFPTSCVMGKDEVGWLYAVQTSNAIPILRTYLEDPSNIDLHREVTSSMLDQLEIAWFNTAIARCFVLRREPLVDVPLCARLPVHGKTDETWFPYPQQVEPVSAIHRNCVLNHAAGLGEIIWHLCDGLYSSGQDGRVPGADIEQIVSKAYDDLLRWRKNVPACIEYDEDSLPDVLSLHMDYHTIIITAVSYLKTSIPNTDSNVATQGSIASIQERLHNFQHFHAALFILMEDLNNPASHDAFLSIANTFALTSGRWLLTRGMFRHVQIAAVQGNKTLSPAIVRLFEKFERRLWRLEDRRRFSNAYPGFAAVLLQQGDGAMDILENG
ncbi:Zn(II)2Cys6 transcription factor [Aspergillus foveolatus]|uniref:Zn(II)2Cys6 transcription factor n=1 Tax=Aspergillus foveolatus TaxID=210207 RepID=UPI003CCDD750